MYQHTQRTLEYFSYFYFSCFATLLFLADRSATIGYWHHTVVCPSVCLSVTLCFLAKRNIIRQKWLIKLLRGVP